VWKLSLENPLAVLFITSLSVIIINGLFFPSRQGIVPTGIDYAATEICPFRGLLQGIVHDENAFAIGGAAGHAGLFGTAGGVHLLLVKLLDALAGKWSTIG
jgi:serine-type D-Ala-D-Ala carboxypeptidase